MALEIVAPNHLPTFVSNQVLTAQLLNNLRDYLDEQTRLSILRGVGRGIVCGLEVTMPSANTIKIEEGYGFTSEGYLIRYEGNTFTHIQAYQDPVYTLLNDGKKKDFELQDYKYDQWEDKIAGVAPNTQIPLWELATATQMPTDTTRRLLTPADLANKLIVLYLEFKPNNLRSCVTSDCNNKGWEINVTVKPILLPKSLMTVVATPLSAELSRIKRLHSEIDLATITNANILNANFNKIALDTATDLDIKILASYNLLKNSLDLGTSLPPKAVDKIATTISTTGFHQYEYDFAKDLTAAYNEFYAAACPFMNRDCDPPNTFGRHLALAAGDFTEGYRHIFVPSTSLILADENRQKVKRLFKRMLMLITTFTPNPSTSPALKLIPSRSEAEPLGRRAIPHYYDLNLIANVKDLWQPKNSCINEVLPLTFTHDYAQLDFIRLVGHIGQEVYSIITAITGFKHTHNLEFDVIPIFLNNPLNPRQQFNNFAFKFTGLEHLNGVPKGGTLILVCDAPTAAAQPARIIADFALEGSIEDCCGCCTDDFNLPNEHFTVFYTPPTTAGTQVVESFGLDVLRGFSATTSISLTIPVTSTKQLATLQPLPIGTHQGVRYTTNFNPSTTRAYQDCFTVEIQSGGIKEKFDVTVLVLPKTEAAQSNLTKVKVSGRVTQNDKAITNALVQLGLIRDLTGTKGEYSIDTELPAGNHIVTAQLPTGVIVAHPDKITVTQGTNVTENRDFVLLIGSVWGRISIGTPMQALKPQYTIVQLFNLKLGTIVKSVIVPVSLNTPMNYAFVDVLEGDYQLSALLFNSDNIQIRRFQTPAFKVIDLPVTPPVIEFIN